MEQKSTKKQWEEYWQSLNHQPQVIHQDLLDNLLEATDVRGKKVLEVGAGMGGDGLFLAKKGARVTVLDFSSKALEKIRASAKKEKIDLETVLADAQKLPFTDQSFDIIFHQGFLEHFRRPEPYLLEQKRVLKKEGLLVVDVPQRFTTYTIKKHLLIWQKKWFAGWEREFSIKELENFLKDCGLEIVRSYGWGYYGKLYKLRHLELGSWYQKVWQRIESSRLGLYLTFSIGVIAQKK